MQTEPHRALIAIKIAHTVVWLIMVGCIFAMPVAAAENHFRIAALLGAAVLAECLVLALNRGRCPLTDLAQRFTDDRAPNFDIFLPAWVARYNKILFGALYLAALGSALWLWKNSVG